MDVQPNVDQLVQKTRQYEFLDGLRDLQMGVYFAVSGVTLWLVFDPIWMSVLSSLLKSFGWWTALIGIVPFILPLLVLLVFLRVMERLRRRWLWRESGMVKSVWWVVPRRVNFFSAVIVVAGMALGLGLRVLGKVDDPFLFRAVWTVTGWAFGYTLIGLGQHIDLTRYVWLGSLGGLASTLVLFLPLPFGQISLIFWESWGLLLLISGGMTLQRVLRSVKRNP